MTHLLRVDRKDQQFYLVIHFTSSKVKTALGIWTRAYERYGIYRIIAVLLSCFSEKVGGAECGWIVVLHLIVDQNKKIKKKNPV